MVSLSLSVVYATDGNRIPYYADRGSFQNAGSFVSRRVSDIAQSYSNAKPNLSIDPDVATPTRIFPPREFIRVNNGAI
jgi:hypothetical protein